MQSQEQARLIADRDGKREVRESFGKEIEKQVRAANKATDLARYVNRFLGDKAKLQLYAKSSTDCIHISVGYVGEKDTPMTSLPLSLDQPAPMEIWAHKSLLSQPVAALLKMATPKTALPEPLKSQFLDALALITAPSDSSINVAFHDDWIVLSLPRDRSATIYPVASSNVLERSPQSQKIASTRV